MRLLLIEDDIAIADYIGACLSNAGHECDMCWKGNPGWWRPRMSISTC